MNHNHKPRPFSLNNTTAKMVPQKNYHKNTAPAAPIQKTSTRSRRVQKTSTRHDAGRGRATLCSYLVELRGARAPSRSVGRQRARPSPSPASVPRARLATAMLDRRRAPQLLLWLGRFVVCDTGGTELLIVVSIEGLDRPAGDAPSAGALAARLDKTRPAKFFCNLKIALNFYRPLFSSGVITINHYCRNALEPWACEAEEPLYN